MIDGRVIVTIGKAKSLMRTRKRKAAQLLLSKSPILAGSLEEWGQQLQWMGLEKLVSLPLRFPFL
jgi:hypothetical protein